MVLPSPLRAPRLHRVASNLILITLHFCVFPGPPIFSQPPLGAPSGRLSSLPRCHRMYLPPPFLTSRYLLDQCRPCHKSLLLPTHFYRRNYSFPFLLVAYQSQPFCLLSICLLIVRPCTLPVRTLPLFLDHISFPSVAWFSLRNLSSMVAATCSGVASAPIRSRLCLFIGGLACSYIPIIHTDCAF